MCRLLGAVTKRVEGHPTSLAEAPKSLAALSHEHPDGWGIAVHDGRDWGLYRNATCARDDEQFRSIASSARGRVLIAHIRKATVGNIDLSNTHPFRRDSWVFAHNGTITDLDYMERRTSSARRCEIEGSTDSERFFAYLLTALDEAGATAGSRKASPGAAYRALRTAVHAATSQPRFGAANFLLSDGEVMFVHRLGRTLHTSSDANGVRVASEVPADGVWHEVPERTLLAIEAGTVPRIGRETSRSALSSIRAAMFSDAPTSAP
ncbi:class II glutamine amidotransferase [Polyangium aurulentum]|uniref:class II glutamine amidotransferase n=1 Tax=Polyangium aurulentum TaxID=2567896 RepID=UPI0023DE7751|nr:class II glutamine amidotransferase [Polyangium aurulentum]